MKSALTPDEFDELVELAMQYGAAASRGMVREGGPVQDAANALVRSAGALALGRQTSRAFPPEALALMNRIADAVVERVSLMSDAHQAGGGTA